MIGQKPHSLEYTKALASGVFHYTCNSPSEFILKKLKIKCLGNDLGCTKDNEVLLIPYKVFLKEGIMVSEDQELLKIASENLLRRVS